MNDFGYSQRWRLGPDGPSPWPSSMILMFFRWCLRLRVCSFMHERDQKCWVSIIIAQGWEEQLQPAHPSPISNHTNVHSYEGEERIHQQTGTDHFYEKTSLPGIIVPADPATEDHVHTKWFLLILCQLLCLHWAKMQWATTAAMCKGLTFLWLSLHIHILLGNGLHCSSVLFHQLINKKQIIL